MVGTRQGARNKKMQNGSCSVCKQSDNMRMVQCDKCDEWFHFECVQVSDDVVNKDWICKKCSDSSISTREDKKQQSEASHNDEFQSPIATAISGGHLEASDRASVCMKLINKSTNISKCDTSKARRKMELQLLQLEEEKKADMAYIKKKYALLHMQESSDESDVESEAHEIAMENVQRVEQWADGMGYIDKGNEVLGCGSLHGGEKGFMGINSGTQQDAKMYSRGDAVFCNNIDDSRNVNQGGARAAHQISVAPPSISAQMYARQVAPRDLPMFSGRPEEWPLFISSYENSTRLCGFSNDENLLRLQRALKGKAFDYVGSKLMLPALVPEIISTLRMAFGKPEHIIYNLLTSLRSSPGVNLNKLQTLVNFSLEVKNIAATMEVSGLHSHLNNPMLIQELIDKLPAQMRLEWAIFSQSITNVNLTIFSNWLFKLAEAASSVIPFSVVNSTQADPEKRKAHRLNFHEDKGRGAVGSNEGQGPPNPSSCVVCNEAHLIVKCDKFKNLSYNDRWNTVRNKRLCRTCLKCHNLNYCQERKECGINSCTAKHHPLLHKSDIVKDENCASPAVVAVHQLQTSRILFRIVPITIYGKGSSVDVYAFLDDGSAPTLIEKGVLDQLQVKGRKSDLCLRWTDGIVRTEKDSELVDLQISSKGKENKKYSLRDVRSVNKLDLPSQTLILPELSKKYKHLKGLPVESYQNIVPSVIIGLNNRCVAMPLKFREGRLDEPAATKTRLGWTIYGELNRDSDSTHINANLQLHICECDDDIALQKLMLENMKVENEYSVTQQQGKSLFENVKLEEYVQRDGDRFVTRLLWKKNNLTLPDNHALALRRLSCFESRLSKDNELKNQVNNHIVGLEAKGYIRKLSDSEINTHYPRKWYLPLFVVKNPNKPQKIRVVWDAAAECNGTSLNGCLEKGPDLLTSLTDVLFNFRVGKIGISGDICEMFHRVAVHTDDQQSQRFLWRNGDSSLSPKVYVLQVMSFGASCSPSLAQYVKNRNAIEHKEQYPRAVKSIIERHYVDDMLDSIDSVQEAVELARDVREVHKHANFHIRNWLSNSTEVTRCLEDAGTPVKFCQAGRTVEQVVEADKVLGMWWETTSDTFTFNLKYTKASEEILRGDKLPTKRELLRLLMSIFDPLGFLSFFCIYMKILLQEIWRSGISWDETIPDTHIDSWRRWLSFLSKVPNIHIPRCYFSRLRRDRSMVELHVFVDASESAYAAVAYFRITNGIEVEISLVCAKTKVAPLRPLSIPRMELLAAVIGARLGNAIVKANDLKIESTHYWSDSKTVLLWLQSDPRKYKQFVMYRIGEIQETTTISNWNYVPSKQNVADLATKWSQQPNFDLTSPWFTGPTFLRKPPELWPSKAILDKSKEQDAELKLASKAHLLAVQENVEYPIVDFTRFSKWERLLRCMAYVRKFIACLKLAIASKKTAKSEPNRNINSSLKTEDLVWSQHFLYRLAQTQAFTSEKRLLLQNANVVLPKSSPLRKLSPFIDKDMIIRIRGRLEKATIIGDATKNPIIMPKDHPITSLLVDWYHRRYKHVNHETVINELFQIFHIISLRTLLRKIRSNCQLCKVRQLLPKPPEMGPLPQARLSAFTRPFSYIGIDFFGPFVVTIGRRQEKRYGAVFTCLTCRAIHVEVAHSLSMSSCAIVIRNFIARRGTPIHIYSDNGTNLKAAEKELQEAHQQVDFQGLQAEFTSPYTKWTFIPPASPHMGGAWERMVRSIKTVLNQIVTPETKMTDETLNNLLLEVESIINSRPLTYLSLDTAEQEALTPNHFLLGSSSGSKPPGIFDATDKYTKYSWRQSQLLADKFWKRWVAEVLPSLTRRTNWFKKAKPIETGDIVIIVDSNLPRHCWPKGIVTSTVQAKDGQVRSAIVRTASGEYHRPAAKIAVLDVGDARGSDDQSCEVLTPMGRNTGGENVVNAATCYGDLL